MPALLGIDLGTSSVKTLLVDPEGQVIGRGSADYPIHHPQPGFAEQDPREWWQATVTAVRQATSSGAAQATEIAAVSFSGQMHGTVFLNAGRQMICPAVIWPDQRSAQQVREITEMVGPTRLIDITGSPVASGFQAATIRWFQQNRPDIWNRVRTILAPKDYLRYRLTGSYQTDPSDGSGTLLLDVHNRDWSTSLLEILEIDPDFLASIQASASVGGTLKAKSAEELGLPPGIPVVVGAADTACGVLGAGLVRDGALLLTISTGGQLVVPVQEPGLDRNGRSHTFCSALEPQPDQAGWYRVAATLSAGLAFRWLRDQVFGLSGATAYDRMVDMAASVPPGANGLLFVPYLVGERSPHMDPQARGLFLGLTAGHGQAELARSVIEGVTLSCYDAFQVLQETGINPTRILMAGGGARSRLWLQVVADVFGLPVQRLEVTEQSAVGATILAGAGIGLFSPAQAASAWSSYASPIEPQPANKAVYQELLGIFRDSYGKHREDFGRLKHLEERA
jgi:xylulokinase